MKRLLPLAAQERLRKRLIELLLPPAVRERRAMTTHEQLHRFAAGTLMSEVEMHRIESEVAREVDRCLPPFVYPDDRGKSGVSLGASWNDANCRQNSIGRSSE